MERDVDRDERDMERERIQVFEKRVLLYLDDYIFEINSSFVSGKKYSFLGLPCGSDDKESA